MREGDEAEFEVTRRCQAAVFSQQYVTYTASLA